MAVVATARIAEHSSAADISLDESQQILAFNRLLLSSTGKRLADLIKAHSAEKVIKALSLSEVAEIIDCDPQAVALSIKQHNAAVIRQKLYRSRYRAELNKKRMDRFRLAQQQRNSGRAVEPNVVNEKPDDER